MITANGSRRHVMNHLLPFVYFTSSDGSFIHQRAGSRSCCSAVHVWLVQLLRGRGSVSAEPVAAIFILKFISLVISFFLPLHIHSDGEMKSQALNLTHHFLSLPPTAPLGRLVHFPHVPSSCITLLSPLCVSVICSFLSLSDFMFSSLLGVQYMSSQLSDSLLADAK